MSPAGADLALILEAARAAGALALQLRAEGLKTEFKAGDSPVTNADLAADDLLKAQLGAARPDYGWLSEESADDPARLTKSRLFVVDPIDGTRAYIKDRPWWAVSIAVVENGRPIAGVVFAPQLDEMFEAVAGEGARRNREPIAAASTRALEGCGMLGDPRMFTHPAWPTPWPQMRVESKNSTAYRICAVGAGDFDAALALVPKHDWDLAAADLIASEAGAYVGDHTGARFRYNGLRPFQRSLVCTAPQLAPLILERVRHIAVGG